MEDRRKSREILKSYFMSGKVPTESQFAEFIDSVPNLTDDHLPECGKKGWKIRSTKNGVPGIGFYPQELIDESTLPAWLLTLSPGKELLLQNEKGETVWSISQDGATRLSGNLSVAEKIFCDSLNNGSPKILQADIVADKEWHNLPIEAEVGEMRQGCRSYSIWICYQNSASNDYGVTEAIVQNRNFQTLKIKSRKKHWWGWSGALRMRWKKEDNGKLYLQIRSNYTDSQHGLHCRITEIGNYTNS